MLHDTLKSANTLRQAGVPEKQAQAMVEVMTDNLATKEDIENLSLATQRDMKELGNSLRHEMKELGTSLRHEMKEMDISIRSDMRNGFNILLKEMEKMNVYRDGQHSLLKWMVAFFGSGMAISISLSMAIVLRLFSP